MNKNSRVNVKVEGASTFTLSATIHVFPLLCTLKLCNGGNLLSQTTSKAQTRGESLQGDATCMRKKKGTIETKKRRFGDWLYLMLSRCKILIGSSSRQNPLSTIELAAIWFQLVDMVYRLQVCPEIESLNVIPILRTRSLECHEMLLLVLHDNTKNGWV